MSTIDNPILNGPYDVPTRHWRFADDGSGITDAVVGSRRPSDTWVPVPRPRKKVRAGEQLTLELQRTDERRERNSQIERIRQVVALWRAKGYPHTTATSQRLLKHWADPERDNRILFAQREAVETAIYVAEAAARSGNDWISSELRQQNQEYNHGLPRVAFKMATGSGKTVVMAMLIAWQTLNKVARPRDPRFSRRFLVVAPGITIRDRLRVLDPNDEGNYFRERDLVPGDLWGALRRARLVVTNFHAFRPKVTVEARGVSANTRKLASARLTEDPFLETPAMVVARVLRGLPPDGGPVVVLNDEAHHCYARADGQVEGAVTESDLKGADKKEAHERNKDAGVWFTGLQHIAASQRLGTVFDLSATPFFLNGSGYREGFIFPWVVSDFSLLDAIESGIVKIPRIPVADDAEGDQVTYLNLWSALDGQLPHRVTRGASYADRDLPVALDGALRSLYASYERSYGRWEQQRADDSHRAGTTPPVFIVVCHNTVVSQWVYQKVAGYSTEVEDSEGAIRVVQVPGQLPLFSNLENNRLLPRPRTILVDSTQLERDDVLSADFRSAAADEIEAFRHEYVARTGSRPDELTDGELLREVLNTVGKPGRLGEGVRCVVSVSMLSEGWDANTVTHVLGVRAFGSQLLCEQVVGRGLRRRSYTVNDEGMFEPEYAEVYGVPFGFIPSDRPVVDPVPGRQPVRVSAVVDRRSARIVFPRLDGYRIEVPDLGLVAAWEKAETFTVRHDELPTETEVSGLVGDVESHDLGTLRRTRARTVAFELARTLLPKFSERAVGAQPWLFPQLVDIADEWLRTRVVYEKDTFPGILLVGERRPEAAEQIYRLIFQADGGREPRVLPVFSPERVGSTDVVDFSTTKRVIETEPALCHVNGVILDGPDGNTWEQIAATTFETLTSEVAAYVKNDHLEFSVPYVHRGHARRYLPDFIVRLTPGDDRIARHLIVEVSGGLKSQEARAEKAHTARNLWCASVNNDGSFGRWGYVEIDDPVKTKPAVLDAIRLLRANRPITGLPSVLDELFTDSLPDDEELLGAIAAH